MNVLLLSVLQQLRPHLPAAAHVCCLGYPDILVSEEQARQILGPEIAARLSYRADSEEILAWHRLESRLDRVIDAEALFAAMGMRFTAVDLVASRGKERIVNLNEPLAPDLVGTFDVVLDAGTMEHCFNVGQAVRNIVDMAKVGGFVIHLNPMAMINHGFFNFSPTFYHDFYGQNGHQLVSPIYGVVVDGIEVASYKVDPIGRFNANDANAMVMCVARKAHDRSPVWPMQSKYLMFPSLKAEETKAI
ncbi:MAG TPA: hypothetical protein VFE34_14970 [Dongiaceae bacterium]|nr:hypothetical protein [Dongiaceae bacterium]